jgi:hypothetical protein
MKTGDRYTFVVRRVFVLFALFVFPSLSVFLDLVFFRRQETVLGVRLFFVASVFVFRAFRTFTMALLGALIDVVLVLALV